MGQVAEVGYLVVPEGRSGCYWLRDAWWHGGAKQLEGPNLAQRIARVCASRVARGSGVTHVWRSVGPTRQPASALRAARVRRPAGGVSPGSRALDTLQRHAKPQ